MGTKCDDCLYFEYDEGVEDYVCVMALDEDEAERLYRGQYAECPYYRPGDEYTIVKKQM